jgi:PEP-CTERM motif
MIIAFMQPSLDINGGIMKKGKILGLLLLAITAMGLTTAQASLINVTEYDTLTQNTGPSTLTVMNDGSSYWSEAQMFHTGATNLSLVDVQLLLSATSAGGQNDPIIGIYANNTISNKPDTSNAALAVLGSKTPAITGSAAVITFTSAAGNVGLAANTNYWVVATATSGSYDWATTTAAPSLVDPNNAWAPATAKRSYSSSVNNPLTSDWSQSPSSSFLNMKIESQTVPEPTTYALLGISLGVIGFARKRMNKTV